MSVDKAIKLLLFTGMRNPVLCAKRIGISESHAWIAPHNHKEIRNLPLTPNTSQGALLGYHHLRPPAAIFAVGMLFYSPFPPDVGFRVQSTGYTAKLCFCFGYGIQKSNMASHGLTMKSTPPPPPKP